MTDPAGSTVNPQVAALSKVLLDRLPVLADELVERILKQVEFYADGGSVPREDLFESCRDNLEFVFRRVAQPELRDTSAPRRTGRRRAEQGAPLASAQNAYRVGFAFMWDCLVTEARRTGVASESQLVELAFQVWSSCEIFTDEMAAAYRDAQVEQVLRREQERSALVAALLEGGLLDSATAWEAADLLGLPYRGPFVVVAAEAPGLARQALPNIDSRLQARGIPSVWRLLPDEQIGIVALRTPEVVTSVISMLSSAARARVGVSPSFDVLEETPHALHLARIAMASGPVGKAVVREFDDDPLPDLVVSSPLTAYRIADHVLGPLLEVVAEEREMLLDTLQVYFEVGGSAVEAGKVLFCHPNTVRHRLRRIEQKTGRSLTNPAESAELYVALEARLRLPDRPTESTPGAVHRFSEHPAGPAHA